MINVPVVSVCKVLCATMEHLTAIAAITGWRGLVKSLLSHPIISIFFCAFFVSCIGSADFVPPDLPTSSLSKTKKKSFWK